MPLTMKAAADKLKGKLPAARTSITSVIQCAGVELGDDMPPGVAAEAEKMAKELLSDAQEIMATFKEYEASLLKVCAKA